MVGHSPDADYLRRLLSQVKPIIRNVCFVCTDKGKAIQSVLDDSGIPFECSVRVFSSREDFDFSVVRNMARKMATKHSGWSIWLDCDDTMERPEQLLESIERVEAEAYALPYEVSPTTANLFKVRVHKADEWHWINSVHEELLPINQKGGQKNVTLFRDLPIVHAPKPDKSNHDFHISLLKKQIKMSPNDYCYLAKEYYNKLDYEGAIPWIEKAIAIHDVSIEIYNLWIMLGIAYAHQGNEERMMDAFFSAIKERPHRREAYFYLAEYCGKKGGKFVLKGLAYITACNAQRDAGEALQHRKVYDSTGWKLHARYLQKIGEWQAAMDIIENATVKDDEYDQIVGECEQALKNEQEPS